MKAWRAGLVCAALASVVSAQSLAAQAAAKPSRLRLGAGGSLMEFDANNDQASRGVVLRGGVAVAWFADLEVVTQYWLDLGYWHGGSALIEGTLYPAGHPRLAPFVHVGLGYFRATDRTDQSIITISGVAKSFGVGVEGRLAGPWGLRLDAAVRFDPHSLDDEIRLAAIYGPRPQRPATLKGGGAQGAIYAIVPFTGPWHAVEPGYGLAFATPIATQQDVTLDILLVHWTTAERTGFSGWDTRAIFLLPALAWVSAREGTRISAGAGPLGTLMVEGPDDGLRAGAHAAAGLAADLGGGLVGSIETRLFWIVRAVNLGFSPVSQLSAADQRGLLLRLAVGF